MKEITIKIHVSRDFSFAEFDTVFDPDTGEGLPTDEDLVRIWEMLPGKDPLAPPASLTEAPKRAEIKPPKQKAGYFKDIPATANQRRTLERYGEWQEGMTKSQASKKLTELGF